ncbi:MAG: hypothetical protein ABI036_03030 [Fibrobacteria bacterium]
MWFRKGATRLCLCFSVLLSVSLTLTACGPTDHSGDPGLISVTVDSSALRFSRLSVILRDSAGHLDTLFDDSLRNPAQLQRIPTDRYRGEPAAILITGFKDGDTVYSEIRGFTGRDHEVDYRDTLRDLSLPISEFKVSEREIILTVGDSSRFLDLSVLPEKADLRFAIVVDSPAILELHLSKVPGPTPPYRLIPLKAGQTWVHFKSIPYPQWRDSASVLIAAPAQTLFAPVNRGPEWTKEARPTWSWSSGGGKGIGFYRARVDNDSLDGAAFFHDTSFTYPDPLTEGPHILYVQERDSSKHWSPAAALLIKVDLTSPDPPAVSNEGLDAVNNPYPAWIWNSGGGGNGVFRYLLDSDRDGEDLDAFGTETLLHRFAATDSLSEGMHVIHVQESDSAGNWSRPGSAAVNVAAKDTVPPKPPVFQPHPPGNPEPFLIDSITWHGGGDGSGHYRYQLDSQDFGNGRGTETSDSSFAPPPDSVNRRYTLYVEERDSVGNWSKPSGFTFNAVHLFFLQSKAQDSDYVLTLVPDSAKVRLTHRITKPKNPAELDRQHMQLWSPEQGGFFREENRYLLNPFANQALRMPGPQGPALTTGYKDSAWTDSGYYFFLPVQVPPAPAGAYRVFQSLKYPGQNLNVQGEGPWDENSPIILWEQSHGEDNEKWRLDPFNGARFVD